MMKTKHMETKAFNFKSSPLVCLGLAILFVISQPVLAKEVLTDKWEYNGAAYLWGAAVGGETSTGAGIDVDFGDITDTLNFGLMGRVGAKKGKWGLDADILYLDLEDKPNIVLNPTATVSQAGLKAWIVTPTASYNVMNTDKANVNLLAGVRYLYMKVGLTVDPLAKVSNSDDVWNGIVGAKGQINLNEKWYVPFYVDVGTGDTDLTWQAFTGIGYKYKKFDLNVGYRYLDYDFEKGDPGSGLLNDLNISGPIIGAKFNF